MATIIVGAFSRPPTAKEGTALEGRRRRIEAPGFEEHLETLTTKLTSYERPGGQLAKAGLRVRPQFSWLPSPIEGDSSDRKAPPRPLRPPATRISSGGSSALRLELLTMALVQLHRKPGAKAHLYELGLSIAGSSSETGWADLIAAQPTDSNNRGLFITSRDKRARTVRSALTTLEEAGLVDVPGQPKQHNRFEQFALLNEAGGVGERSEYTVPTKSESQFQLPPGFVLNNWLHVLEDSEIAVLLMAACTRGAWSENDMWAFPGAVRLRHYGIHRDPYSRARKTLEWFGLLDVLEPGRHEDGRAEDDERMVHRVRLNTEAFERPALPTMRKALEDLTFLAGLNRARS